MNDADGKKSRAALFCLFLVLLAGCYAFVVRVRLGQIQTWQTNPSAYFVADSPMMTTHDAYVWIKWAKNYKRYAFDGDLTGEPWKLSATDPNFFPEKMPLLSQAMAVAAHFTGWSVKNVGFHAIPWLAGLFILPLGFYFRKLDLPHAGMLGGLVGALAPEYVIRTSVGRLDTDSLNLFFPSLIAMCLVNAGGSTLRYALWHALAGLACLFFHWWYERPLFTLLFFGLAALRLLWDRVGWKTALAALAAFALFSGPAQVMEGFGNLLQKISFYANVTKPLKDQVSQGVHLPNVLLTISEAQHFTVEQNLSLLLQDPALSAAGLLLFAGLAVTNFRRVMFLLPMLAIGLFAFQSGRRFAMYLGPFVGIGYGWGIWLVLKAAARLKERLAKPGRNPPKKRRAQNEPKPRPNPFAFPLASYVLSAALFASIYGKTAAGFVPGPSISTQTYSSVMHVKSAVPKGSWMWNFWDYGYFLNEAGEFNVYNDGSGSQFSPITYFTAKSYISDDQREMRDIIGFLHNGLTASGTNFNDMNALPTLLEKFNGARGAPDGNVYVLYTANLIRIFPLVRMLGTWNLKTGEHSHEGYQILSCFQYDGNKQVLSCSSGEADLNQGTLGGQAILGKALLINNGKAVKTWDYQRPGAVLQMLTNEGGLTHTLLMKEEYYLSNLNQMYLLGRYDPSLFEEVYNNFPEVRLFRVRTGAETRPPH